MSCLRFRISLQFFILFTVIINWNYCHAKKAVFENLDISKCQLHKLKSETRKLILSKCTECKKVLENDETTSPYIEYLFRCHDLERESLWITVCKPKCLNPSNKIELPGLKNIPVFEKIRLQRNSKNEFRIPRYCQCVHSQKRFEKYANT